MSAQPSPRTRPNPNASPAPKGGDGPRARLTVAPDVARRRLRARLIMWAAGLVTVASLFTLVSFHVFAAQSAFTLERLSKEQTNEQLRYERLRDQVATLSSAPTVIAAATRLGMVQGPTVIPLSVAPSASGGAGVSTTPTLPTTPTSSPGTSTGSYQDAKRALAPTG